MYVDPVCDMENNEYDNKECALCEGIPEEQIQPCGPFVVLGTGAPGENILF